MKLNFLTKLLVSVFLAFCAFGFVACSDDDDGSSVDSALVGTWGGDGYEIILKSDGTFIFSSDGEEHDRGTFSTSGGKITFKYSDGETETVSYRVESNNLILDGTVLTKK
ncbi:MAG: copper resistance protein NlpE [Chitinivibrionia bacterium]|nr:copper resistance protein NlpE [Chitinivibrionia bacterium]